MSNIDPLQAADVLIEQKGKRQAFEYIFKYLKLSNEIGEMYSYHEWADVLRAYAKLVVNQTTHRPTLH